ncbi:hypothetical protein F442_00879 [Phytophthora nicotianae P10297]|uniref:Uncharacterized protein n=1 Tax=Phytophthora nicotianae P10297 TaxID=1317064 RepID=W3A774_PHYNI|nr:hypothetical protein F442_00879 [Phytophthora nicotianae P10297]
MNVVSDSALTCSTVMAGRILNPLKEGDLNRILPSIRSSARTIISLWQAAECAIGSVETVYHQLKLPLPYNPQLRLRINNLFRVARYCVCDENLLSDSRTVNVMACVCGTTVKHLSTNCERL